MADTALTHKQKNKLIAVIAVLLTFTVMNGTMFNVAIPDISEEFQLLPSQVAWVMTGYILVFAIGSLMYGKLADQYPIKRLMTIGIILFSTGALIGLLSGSFAMLLAARIIQASGGATIPALAFVIPARFMPEDRGRVFGIVSSTVAFASGIGPIMGGTIGGTFDWRLLFIFSILAVFTIPLLRNWIPDEITRPGSTDIPGAIFIASAVAFLLISITSYSMIWLIFGLLAFLLFIWRIRTFHTPFVDPAIFKDTRYMAVIATSFLSTSAMFGMIFIVPIMARSVYDLSTIQIGMLLFPGAMAAGLIGQFGGKLTDRHGPEPILRAALIIAITGSVLIATLIGVPPILLALAIVIQYAAFPLIQTSTASLLTYLVPVDKTGVGIGFFNLMNFMSGAISSAVFGAFLDLGSIRYSLNPIAVHPEFALYSTLFVILGLLALSAMILFTSVFRMKKIPVES